MANGNIADGKLGSPNREQNGMLRERHRLSVGMDLTGQG